MLRTVTGTARVAPPRATSPSSATRRTRSTRGRGLSACPVEPLEARTLLSSGDLDPTFGVGGVVTTDVPGSSGNRVARQLALQSDGKIVQVAWHGGFGASEPMLAVTRFNTDGSTDTSFGQDGLQVVDYPGRGEVFGSVAIGPDDEVVVATWTTVPTTDFLAADSDVTVAVLNADGSFDTSFGNGGYTTFDIGRAAGGPSAAKTTDLVFDVAVQGDGKIVTAGSVGIGVGRFGLARLNTDGSLDTTFGTGGVVTAPFGDNVAAANALDVDADGRLVVIGTIGALTGTPPRVADQDWAVARYNPDGSLDTTFDGDGWTVTSFGPNFDTPFRIQVTAGGKIVASGSAVQTTTGTDMAVARYNANGSLDGTFSGDGKATFSNQVRDTSGRLVEAVEEAEGLAVQDDGSVLISGNSGVGFTQTNGQVLLVRLTPSGNPDPSFGTAGKVVVPELDEGHAVAIQPDDGYVIVGGHVTSDTSGFEDFALARFDPSGNPDSFFGPSGNGVATADFPANGFTTITGGALQPDGKIVVGGFTIVRNDNLSDILLARYTEDGVLDDTFGVGGIVQIDLGAAAGADLRERMTALALDADGKIVFTGFVNDPGSESQDILVGRMLSDGSPDPDFGGGGFVQIGSFAGNSKGNEEGRDVLVQPDGRIVVVGKYSTSSANQFAALRLEYNGDFDSSFGTGGGTMNLQIPGGVTDSYANAVALAPDQDGQGYDLVLAGRARVGSDDRFALVRLDEDGTPDFNFGTLGTVTATMTGATVGVANDVVVDTQGRILAGGSARRDGNDFAMMRFTPAGVLDATFDGDGRVLTDFDAAGDDVINSLALLPDGTILAGGTGSANFALARYGADGALDTSFGTGGRAVHDFEIGFYPGAPVVSRDQGVEVLAYPGGRAVMVGTALLPRTGSDLAAVRFTLAGPPNAAPVANPGGPYVMNEGGSTGITLTAAGSADADGRIVRYQWDLSYDQFSGFQPDAQAEQVTFPAQADETSGNQIGRRRVALRVTDDNFATHTVIFDITVNNVAPAIAPIPDVTIPQGTPFTATGSFTDPGTTDTFTASVNYGDGASAALPLNADKTFTLNHAYANPGSYRVVVTVRDNDGGVGTDEILVNVRGSENHVSGRSIFYHRSRFETGGNALSAVPAQKVPLLPGGTATGVNITNYTRGINGIIITLDGAAGGAITAADFVFKAGTGGDPATWAPAPAPESVQATTLPGTPQTQIVITWADGAIKNKWLQTTVLANVRTKLLAPDVFYFGNLVGNAASPPGRIDMADYLRTRAAMSGAAVPITNNSDHDHDGRVGALDVAAVKRNLFQTIQLITAPAAAAAAPGVIAAVAWPSVPPAASVLTPTSMWAIATDSERDGADGTGLLS